MPTTAKPTPRRSSALAAGKTQTDELIVRIPLEKLHDHPGNPEATEPEIVAMMAWLSEQRQQEPITVRELAEPIGHYQVLAGKTRLAAARRLGWEALEARVRSDLADDAAAIRFAATNNSLRRSETTLRQARWVAYLVEQGQGIEEAGRLFGWSRSHATNMLGLLKLPEPWLSRVASGELPPTVACRLNPYTGISDLMKAFDKDYKLNENVARLWSHKDGIVGRIRSVLDECTRPMEGGKHNYGWALGGEHRRYFHEDDAATDLRCVELPIGKNGALRRVALNVKEYDRLNMPEIKKRLDAQRRAYDSKNRTQGDTPAPLATAEKRKKHDEQLCAWIAGVWRPAFLRLCASDAVRALPGGEQWRYQVLLPRLIEACGQVGVPMFQFEAVAAGAWKENDRYRGDIDHWRLEQTLATIREDEDPVTDVEERQRAHVALLLWPQDERPRDNGASWITCVTADLPFGGRLPPLSVPAIEAIAGLVDIPLAREPYNGARIGNVAWGWSSGVVKGRQREMVRIFLARHTRPQLDSLAAELCASRAAPDGHLPARTWIREAASKGDQVERLMQLHTTGKPLPLPTCLRAPSKPPRARRGAGR